MKLPRGHLGRRRRLRSLGGGGCTLARRRVAAAGHRRMSATSQWARRRRRWARLALGSWVWPVVVYRGGESEAFNMDEGFFVILALLVPPLVTLGTLAPGHRRWPRRPAGAPWSSRPSTSGQVLIAAGLGLAVSRAIAGPRALAHRGPDRGRRCSARRSYCVVNTAPRGQRRGLDGHDLAGVHQRPPDPGDAGRRGGPGRRGPGPGDPGPRCGRWRWRSPGWCWSAGSSAPGSRRCMTAPGWRGCTRSRWRPTGGCGRRRCSRRSWGRCGGCCAARRRP